MNISRLSIEPGLGFLNKRCNDAGKAIKDAELRDEEFRKFGISDALAKGDLLKTSAGGHAYAALVKHAGKPSKAYRAASKSDKANRGPTISKQAVGRLNEMMADNPYLGATLTPGAAKRVKRDAFKTWMDRFEKEVEKNRDKGVDALRDFESQHKLAVSVVKTLEKSSTSDHVLSAVKEFLQDHGEFDEDRVDHCLERLNHLHSLLRKERTESPKGNESPTYEESQLVNCAGKMHSSLDSVKKSGEAMNEAIVFRDIYAALRETQRNSSYRWLAARISPEMRGHLASAFSIFGIATMILSVPLMVGPLKDWIAGIFHHRSNQQQQQQQGQ